MAQNIKEGKVPKSERSTTDIDDTPQNVVKQNHSNDTKKSAIKQEKVSEDEVVPTSKQLKPEVIINKNRNQEPKQGSKSAKRENLEDKVKKEEDTFRASVDEEFDKVYNEIMTESQTKLLKEKETKTNRTQKNLIKLSKDTTNGFNEMVKQIQDANTDKDRNHPQPVHKSKDERTLKTPAPNFNSNQKPIKASDQKPKIKEQSEDNNDSSLHTPEESSGTVSTFRIGEDQQSSTSPETKSIDELCNKTTHHQKESTDFGNSFMNLTEVEQFGEEETWETRFARRSSGNQNYAMNPRRGSSNSTTLKEIALEETSLPRIVVTEKGSVKEVLHHNDLEEDLKGGGKEDDRSNNQCSRSINSSHSSSSFRTAGDFETITLKNQTPTFNQSAGSSNPKQNNQSSVSKKDPIRNAKEQPKTPMQNSKLMKTQSARKQDTNAPTCNKQVITKETKKQQMNTKTPTLKNVTIKSQQTKKPDAKKEPKVNVPNNKKDSKPQDSRTPNKHESPNWHQRLSKTVLHNFTSQFGVKKSLQQSHESLSSSESFCRQHCNGNIPTLFIFEDSSCCSMPSLHFCSKCIKPTEDCICCCPGECCVAYEPISLDGSLCGYLEKMDCSGVQNFAYVQTEGEFCLNEVVLKSLIGIIALQISWRCLKIGKCPLIVVPISATVAALLKLNTKLSTLVTRS